MSGPVAVRTKITRVSGISDGNWSAGVVDDGVAPSAKLEQDARGRLSVSPQRTDLSALRTGTWLPESVQGKTYIRGGAWLRWPEVFFVRIGLCAFSIRFPLLNAPKTVQSIVRTTGTGFLSSVRSVSLLMPSAISRREEEIPRGAIKSCPSKMLLFRGASPRCLGSVRGAGHTATMRPLLAQRLHACSFSFVLDAHVVLHLNQPVCSAFMLHRAGLRGSDGPASPPPEQLHRLCLTGGRGAALSVSFRWRPGAGYDMVAHPSHWPFCCRLCRPYPNALMRRGDAVSATPVKSILPGCFTPSPEP